MPTNQTNIKPSPDAAQAGTNNPQAQVGQRDDANAGSASAGQKEFAVSSNPTMNNDNPNVQRATREDEEKNPQDSEHPKGQPRDDSGNQQGSRSSNASNGAGTP